MFVIEAVAMIAYIVFIAHVMIRMGNIEYKRTEKIVEQVADVIAGSTVRHQPVEKTKFTLADRVKSSLTMYLMIFAMIDISLAVIWYIHLGEPYASYGIYEDWILPLVVFPGYVGIPSAIVGFALPQLVKNVDDNRQHK